MVNSQQKGAAGEREFIKEVERLIPGLTLFRNTYQQRVESNHSDVLGVPGFAVEVKRYGKTTTDWYQSAWWTQACDAAERVNAIPLLGYRYNRRPWRAVVPWDFRDTHHPVVCDLAVVCERINQTLTLLTEKYKDEHK